MENASKALIIAASTLIAVVLLSMMVYIFRRFGDTADTTEKKFEQRVIDAFNAKFVGYDTGGNHSLDDEFSVTLFGDDSNETITTTYNNIFKAPIILSTNPRKVFTPNKDCLDLYYKELISISQNLNKGADVVTCINDAININYQNNNGYKYNGLEVQSSIEVIVDLNDNGTGTNPLNEFNFSKKNDTVHYQYLVIEPNKSVKAKYVYAQDSLKTNKEENVNSFSTANPVSVYDMLKELRTTKVINKDNKSYTIYKYYFIGEVFTNETTGLIDTVKFTLVKDKNF